MNKISKIIIGLLSLTVIILLFVVLNPFGKATPTTPTSVTSNITTQVTQPAETTVSTTQTTMNTVPVSSVVPTNPSISQEQAINTALSHAGFDRNTVRISSVTLESFDDMIQVLHYDIDFIDNMGFEYEYKIDASNGQIIRNKKELD